MYGYFTSSLQTYFPNCVLTAPVPAVIAGILSYGVNTCFQTGQRASPPGGQRPRPLPEARLHPDLAPSCLHLSAPPVPSQGHYVNLPEVGAPRGPRHGQRFLRGAPFLALREVSPW